MKNRKPFPSKEKVLDQITAKLKEMGKLPEDWEKPTDIQIEA